jgi:hypothetical protein
VLNAPGGVAIYDTSTPVPSLVTSATLRGEGHVTQVLMSADRTICSLGEWGVQTVLQ